MYVVIENTPGYLPEAEAWPTDNINEARMQFVEAMDSLEADGYVQVDADETWAYYQLHENDLGRMLVIEVVADEEEGE